jgi:peptidoglycan/xylan/chitin deacetylase (PgdA/CDA1 family)
MRSTYSRTWCCGNWHRNGGRRSAVSWNGSPRLSTPATPTICGDTLNAVAQPNVTIRYYVQTTEPVVAFTFDDGPGPRWTPMVLDALDAAQVPATFFMVGRNLRAHAGLVRNRLSRHEVGNHSWSHNDLATLDLAGVKAELNRTHTLIQRVTGHTPTLLRPPYGHLGGSTLLAADSLGYDIVLWSQQMDERRYRRDPAGQTRDLLDSVRPGSIILAHDVGRADRLVALRQLGAMFDGLKARGFRLVTVSDLVATASRTPGAAP